MHCFLPFSDYETLSIIENELVDVKIIKDYNLLDDITDSKVNKVKKDLEDVVVDILIKHDDYFTGESIINKSIVFDLDEIKENYRCISKGTQSRVWKSPQVLELHNMGYVNIGKKNISFLDNAI